MRTTLGEGGLELESTQLPLAAHQLWAQGGAKGTIMKEGSEQGSEAGPWPGEGEGDCDCAPSWEGAQRGEGK